MRVDSGEVTWVNCGIVREVPQSAPLKIQKIDKETGKAVPMGGATLKDAKFQIVYTDGAQITRTWIVKTDENGVADLTDASFVSGDARYKNSQNQYVVPLGRVTITEIDPPTGYLKNNGTITVNINWEGDQATSETTQNIIAS